MILNQIRERHLTNWLSTGCNILTKSGGYLTNFLGSEIIPSRAVAAAVAGEAM